MTSSGGEQSAESPRLLILRRSSLGDIVNTMPTLVALRRGFPRAHIAWLVDNRFCQVLEGHACLDEVIAIRRHNPGQILALLLEARRAGRILRQRDFDIALDLQGLLKSGVMAHLSGASRRLTFADEQREFNQFFTNERVQVNSGTRAVRRFLQMAAYLGCPVEPVEYRFPIGRPQERWAGDFLAEHQVERARPLVGLNVGASAAHRLWPPQHFARLAEMLQTDCAVQTVILSGPREAGIARNIQQLAAVDTVSAAGQTTVKQLAALLSRCAVVVSSDTGPLHIAVAVGTPVVGLYGSPDPDKTGPFGEDNTVLTADLPCSPCVNRPTCRDYPCMREIQPERVAEAVLNLLQRRRPAEPGPVSAAPPTPCAGGTE